MSATQVEVSIRHDNGASLVTYRATALEDRLPTHFENGQQNITVTTGVHTVLWTSSDRRTVEIDIPGLCVLIVIRLYDNHLTVATLIPATPLPGQQQHSQLCYSGCPAEEFVARYNWRSPVDHTPEHLRSPPTTSPNLRKATRSPDAHTACSAVLGESPSVFLSACRWDVGLRLKPSQAPLRDQFVYSSGLAAYDHICLTRLGQGKQVFPTKATSAGCQFRTSSLATSWQLLLAWAVLLHNLPAHLSS